MSPLPVPGLSRPDGLDFLEFREGWRGAARLSVRDPHLVPLLERLDAAGVAWGLRNTPESGRDIFGGHDERRRHDDDFEVFVAGDAEAVQGLIAAFEAKDRHDEIGSRLGYPACCRAAFVETHRALAAGRDDTLVTSHPYLSAAIRNARARGLSRFERIMSPVLSQRILSFFPCRFDCPDALRIARRRLGLLTGVPAWRPEDSCLSCRGGALGPAGIELRFTGDLG